MQTEISQKKKQKKKQPLTCFKMVCVLKIIVFKPLKSDMILKSQAKGYSRKIIFCYS